MERVICNAFTRSRRPIDAGVLSADHTSDPASDTGLGQSPAPFHVRNPAHNFDPLRAVITTDQSGCQLRLSPMQASDVVAAWRTLHVGEHEATLIFGDRRLEHRMDDPGLSLPALVRRMQIPARPLSADALAMTDDALEQLLGRVAFDRLHLIRIDGPIEPLDATVIAAALRKGMSPLDVELRAVASIEVVDDARITMHGRTTTPLISLLAENFRQYLAAICQRPAATFSPPHEAQLERLLSINGELTVRPIETRIDSTAIDIGICTACNGQEVPAAQSLIYDLPSDTWHDEP